MLEKLKFSILRIEERLEDAFVKNDPKLAQNLLEKVPSHILEQISSKRAKVVFEHAKEKTPGYQKFLKYKKYNSNTKWENIPHTDKSNYIKKYSLRERCLNGKLPENGEVYESSGSSGKPTLWVQNKAEEEVLFSEMAFEYHYLFQSKPTVIISTWITGPWITGNKFCEVASHSALLKNTGSDMQNILETLKDFGSKEHYLIVGYPPFIRQLILFLKQNINLNQYSLDIGLGGEAVSLQAYEFLAKQLPKKSLILSSYGASDLDIGVGFENPFCQYVRTLASKNTNFHKELFGTKTGDLPMVFQYNPTLYYVEGTPNKDKTKSELLFTQLNTEVAHPKIKYNLHDLGEQISFTQVINLLEKYDPNYLQKYQKSIQFRSILPLPFFLVRGRSDGMLTIGSANVYPHQIELCFSQEKSVHPHINHFKISKSQNKKMQEMFEIHVELKHGVTVPKTFSSDCQKTVLKFLGKFNADYAELAKNNPEMKNFVVNIYPFGHQIFKADTGKIKRNFFLSK